MISITLLLFCFLIFSFFGGEKYKSYKKTLSYIFLISLITTLIYYQINIYLITFLLFSILGLAFFGGEEYKSYTKILTFASLISLTISVIYYNIDDYKDEQKRIEQEKLVLDKKRTDQKQDSLLIIMEKEIDNYLEKKDTIRVNESLKTFYHTSDSLSPYKNDGFFSGEEKITYKEYWDAKRKEKIKKLEKIKEKSLFNKIFN
jgi:hypothetical protein